MARNCSTCGKNPQCQRKEKMVQVENELTRKVRKEMPVIKNELGVQIEGQTVSVIITPGHCEDYERIKKKRGQPLMLTDHIAVDAFV